MTAPFSFTLHHSPLTMRYPFTVYYGKKGTAYSKRMVNRKLKTVNGTGGAL